MLFLRISPAAGCSTSSRATNVGALRQLFDLVLFMGVHYHLRHPLLALDLLRQYAVRRRLVLHALPRSVAGR